MPASPGRLDQEDMQDTLYESRLETLPLVNRGKVRDIYAVGTDHLLIVTTSYNFV